MVPLIRRSVVTCIFASFRSLYSSSLATDKTDDEDKNRVFVKRVYYHSCVIFSRGQICRATPSHLKKKGEHFAKESLIGVFLERISFLCFHYREFHFSSIFFISVADIDFGSIDCFIDCCNFVSWRNYFRVLLEDHYILVQINVRNDTNILI